jgi:hypothetical protein
VPRLHPGSPLAAPAPIGIVMRPTEGWFAAIAAARLSRLPTSSPPEGPQSLRALLQPLVGDGAADLALGACVQRRRTEVVRVAARATPG